MAVSTPRARQMIAEALSSKAKAIAFFAFGTMTF
jgi:hypothetical protein